MTGKLRSKCWKSKKSSGIASDSTSFLPYHKGIVTFLWTLWNDLQRVWFIEMILIGVMLFYFSFCNFIGLITMGLLLRIGIGDGELIWKILQEWIQHVRFLPSSYFLLDFAEFFCLFFQSGLVEFCSTIKNQRRDTRKER